MRTNIDFVQWMLWTLAIAMFSWGISILGEGSRYDNFESLFMIFGSGGLAINLILKAARSYRW